MEKLNLTQQKYTFTIHKSTQNKTQKTKDWFSCHLRQPAGNGEGLLHRVSKNVPPLACYNFDAHE